MPLLVAVGSKNPCKVQAVRDVLSPEDEVHGFSVPTSVSEQPLSRREIIAGAKARAEAAFKKAQAELVSHSSHQPCTEGGAVGGEELEQSTSGTASSSTTPNSVISSSRKLLAFGIESGLCRAENDDYDVGKKTIDFSHTDATGWFDIAVACCYDGEKHRLGFSCGFEIPVAIMQHVFKGADLGEACQRAGITAKENLGEEEGLIGILTKGKITRKSHTKEALICSLIAEGNPEWF